VSSNRDRGSVLVADLVLGCALVLIIAAAASAAGIIVDTTQSSREAARMGAVAIARGWELEGALIRAGALAPPAAVQERRLDEFAQAYEEVNRAAGAISYSRSRSCGHWYRSVFQGIPTWLSVGRCSAR